MSWITITWSMVSSACLTLAAIHLFAWLMNRRMWANLFFSLAAVSVAAFAFCGLVMMRADTPGEFVTTQRWAQVPLRLLVVSLVGFVWHYLRAGRRLIGWTVCGLAGAALLLSFLTGQSLNYREVAGLDHISFLGESVAIAQGVTNPWVVVGQLNGMLLLWFVADATVAAWRRGDRRQALMVGGSIAFFVAIATVQSVLLLWGSVRAPYTASLYFVGIVAVMGYELSRDTLRASQLVADLQASEAELRESEERLRLAAEATQLGIWFQDLTRDDIWANDTWRTLFGFSREERLDFEGVVRRLHGDDREAVRETMLSALECDDSYEVEHRVVLPDGRVRWVSSRGRAQRDDAGKPVLVRGVSIDVTGRKDAERVIQGLRQEVIHVSRVSMMGQLASALAHEINQPLGAILRNAEAAELFLKHPSPDLGEVRSILADIVRSDQRAGAVIDRMRALLKRQELQAVRLDVSGLVSDVVTLVHADAIARRVRVDVRVPPDLPPVRGDRVHLQQVLLNLVINAMDALDGANEEDRRVTVTARPDGPRVIELAVSDAGRGIPAEVLAHVFDPFFTTKPHGMGMGLPISRTIVETHGGRLWAENNHLAGATFRLTLPTAEEAEDGRPRTHYSDRG